MTALHSNVTTSPPLDVTTPTPGPGLYKHRDEQMSYSFIMGNGSNGLNELGARSVAEDNNYLLKVNFMGCLN